MTTQEKSIEKPSQITRFPPFFCFVLFLCVFIEKKGIMEVYWVFFLIVSGRSQSTSWTVANA